MTRPISTVALAELTGAIDETWAPGETVFVHQVRVAFDTAVAATSELFTIKNVPDPNVANVVAAHTCVTRSEDAQNDQYLCFDNVGWVVRGDTLQFEYTNTNARKAYVTIQYDRSGDR